jgi:hypothetical protein
MILEMMAERGFDVALCESFIERIPKFLVPWSCYLANTTCLFSEHMP